MILSSVRLDGMLVLPSSQYTVSFLNFSILAQHKDVCSLALFTHGYIQKRGVQDILSQPSTFPIATEDKGFPDGSVTHNSLDIVWKLLEL